MSKNPFVNSLVALAYIVVVVFTINIIDETEVNSGLAQYIMPVMVISLFTLSAAVMGYIFCFKPITLFLEGKKEEAVKLFLKTVGIFGIITLGLILFSILVIGQQ
ncbi:hypothetical protein CVU76_01765 [Candidatus Dojkabacteria bacterium HGW-Dojkabacteria-1]|uniref:Uncharacterized protein n=1 Tax=Candidatus Dojkabacteria bacterium HGW-Dojkabacteria-1 TaxID=2013761 RepID=A0A2N2F3L5_9BACT|nr:MAG: hypothetical protein CVU76_01765 [Candidatus Dojkabacteria bacterium HGW-Dojkabacteria-1]